MNNLITSLRSYEHWTKNMQSLQSSFAKIPTNFVNLLDSLSAVLRQPSCPYTSSMEDMRACYKQQAAHLRSTLHQYLPFFVLTIVVVVMTSMLMDFITRKIEIEGMYAHASPPTS